MVLDDLARELEGSPTEPRMVERELRGDVVNERFRDQAEAMAGPTSYEPALRGTGADLTGELELIEVDLTLDRAVMSAIEHNLAAQVAGFRPGIALEQVVAARSVFDFVFFADLDWNVTDQPSQVPFFGGSSATQLQSVAGSAGIRKRTEIGGDLTVTLAQTYSDNDSGLDLEPNPANETSVVLRYDQPLLRGFGRAVNTAEIRIAENFEASEAQALRSALIDTVAQTEQAYWSLLSARQALQIRQRLLERGESVRDVLTIRGDYDARPAEVADAAARVESRRADLIRAENQLRQASDRLKVLMNDPAMPVGGEELLNPVDAPTGEAISFSLLGALGTAIGLRPEIEQAILSVDNADVRLELAENATLPRLDLALQASFAGLRRSGEDAWSDSFDRRFASTLVGLSFEQPIGNRGAEADERRRRLERLQLLTQYRQVIQQVTFEVKTALREVETNYRLIEQTRVARLSAAENLRAILVQRETTQGLTPTFLDLELRRQESLALAELQEIAAITDYANAIAEYFRATGQSLERRGVSVIEPTGEAGGDPAKGMD